MSIGRKFCSYLNKYKKWIMFIIFFLLLESLVEVLSPLILSNIIENGIGNYNKNYIFYSLLFMLFLMLVGILGSIFSSYFSASVSSFFIYDLRKKLFETIMNLSSLEMDRLDISKVTTILSNDIEVIGTVLSSGMRIILKIPFLFIGSLLFSFLLSKKFFLILIFLLPVMCIFIYFILKKAYPYFDSTKEALDDVNRTVRENIAGKKLIKVMNTENLENDKFWKKNRDLMNINIKAMKTITFISPVVMFFIYFATFLVLILGYDYIQKEIVEIGTIMAFLQYLTMILTSLLMGAMLILLCSQTWISLKRVFSILEKDIEHQKENGIPFKNDCIIFKNVHFCYGINSKDTLKALSFQIQPGEKVALVGRCGSGKTTLLKLLGGFYEPTKGEILLGNFSLNQYKNVRENIVYNSQNMVLFKGTIKSNILFFKKSKNMDCVLKISNIKPILEKKEKGILSRVESYGKNLSGGEKNRISLARCLNRNYEILLLDDSLSAVDLKTEKEILENLEKYEKNKTIIYATSRLTNLDKMDKVLFLEKGQVEVFGTFNEVLKNPLFKELYTLSQEVQDGR